MDKRNKIEQKGQSWEDALRDKLDGYDYPIGELPPLVLPTGKRSKGRLVPWWVTIGSVAASLLFVALLLQESDPMVILSMPEELEFSAQSPIVAHAPDATLVASNKSVGQAITPSPIIEEVVESEVVSEVVLEIKAVDDRAVVSNEAQVEQDNIAPIAQRDRTVHIETPKRGVDKGISIGVNVSGAPAGHRGDQVDQLMGFSITNDIKRFSPAEEQSYSVREKLPTEVSVTAIVPIAPKLSVESGLHYVLRRFEVTSSRGFMSEQYDMDVHLVGIPLGLQYEVCQLGRLGLNVAAGVSGNLPIAVAVHGNQIEEQKAHFALDGYMTLVVDYRISRSIALAASVGGAYDIIPLNQRLFEDASSRLRLKMNVGLKFTIQ